MFIKMAVKSGSFDRRITSLWMVGLAAVKDLQNLDIQRPIDTTLGKVQKKKTKEEDNYCMRAESLDNLNIPRT